MATEISGLAGEVVAFTYPSLIKVADNQLIPTVQGGNRNIEAVFKNDNRGTAIPSALARFSDGAGNLTSLAVGQNLAGAKIFGPTCIQGDRQGGAGVAANLLEVCNGGVCIDDNIYVKSDAGSGTNNICGFSCLGSLKVDGSTTLVGSALLCSTLEVCTTSTLHGCATLNGGALVASGALNVCGIIEAQGNIRSKADIIAFYSSDKNLKNNIIPITDSNNVINSINGYEFDWNDKTDREGHDYGVIAQEVQKVAPTLVKKRADGYLAVDYIKLIPILIEEVKSLNNRIKVLEEK
tara:strand:- start:5487 stop:6368 length:882 start_codon:yes stop_codon:yes gene_type:complete